MAKALKIAQIECAKVLEAQIALSPAADITLSPDPVQRAILQYGYRVSLMSTVPHYMMYKDK